MHVVYSGFVISNDYKYIGVDSINRSELEACGYRAKIWYRQKLLESYHRAPPRAEHGRRCRIGWVSCRDFLHFRTMPCLRMNQSLCPPFHARSIMAETPANSYKLIDNFRGAWFKISNSLMGMLMRIWRDDYSGRLKSKLGND